MLLAYYRDHAYNNETVRHIEGVGQAAFFKRVSALYSELSGEPCSDRQIKTHITKLRNNELRLYGCKRGNVFAAQIACFLASDEGRHVTQLLQSPEDPVTIFREVSVGAFSAAAIMAQAELAAGSLEEYQIPPLSERLFNIRQSFVPGPRTGHAVWPQEVLDAWRCVLLAGDQFGKQQLRFECHLGCHKVNELCLVLESDLSYELYHAGAIARLPPDGPALKVLSTQEALCDVLHFAQQCRPCDCPRHRGGPACEVELELEPLNQRCHKMGYPGLESCVSEANKCFNGCQGRGKCVAGFCHCRPGFFGADCALSMGPHGKPELLADQGYKPRARGPRVYMYELPPDMTVWRNDLRADRPTGHFFIERLIATGARVADGDSADWYFIPVRIRTTGDGPHLAAAVRYIRATHPWWNRTMGHRHFVIVTGDMGRAESERDHLSANVTFVTHWGLYRDKPFSNWRASHRNATDIVLPVFLGANKLNVMGIFKSRNHPKFATHAPEELRRGDGPTFFFAGRICGDHSRPRLDGVWPHCETARSVGYSGGTRQKMQAALAGCVPVVIADNVLEAFEPYVDWNTFGVRLREDDIPNLHTILESIGPEEYARKLGRLRCAAQHMAFSTVTGGFMGEDGRYDAYETLLEILRAKAAHPHAPPEQLRSLDPQLDAFLDCRAHLLPAAQPGTAAGATDGTSAVDESASMEGDVGAEGEVEAEGATATEGEVEAEGAKAVAAAKDGGAGGAGGAGARGGGGGGGSWTEPWLCSVSPYDVQDTAVVMCRQLRHKGAGPLYGGMMCAAAPQNMTACVRPWP
ncbi:hypothetical protein GPECTOR_74g694 [Gonium pectorale]|uniref:EGF-like domain-containing protein n=1 Tax=Gonium pectorale TaxID=33097 RepID=A0A150G455_GONPE|nr:hypothetical protein GPECTOR_74g694 [Gonium pectorale]|eukprot:KXZ44080.1 hypothetical protein GPECTOR_74g694 [Gonium pectorale]